MSGFSRLPTSTDYASGGFLSPARGLCPSFRAPVALLSVVFRTGPMWTAICLLISVILVQDLHAQPAPEYTGERPFSADLDGLYLALGPVASAIRAGDAWDGSFGGELLLVRVRERSAVTGLGWAVGASRHARGPDRGLGRGTGRVWTDLLIGTRSIGGLVTGLGAGLVAEVDPVDAPRWGGQASVWLFAGVIPFIRLGAVQKNGTYIDFGIKVALPAVRI